MEQKQNESECVNKGAIKGLPLCQIFGIDLVFKFLGGLCAYNA